MVRFKKNDGTEYSKWKEKLLGDLCDVRDGTHSSPKYVTNGYPLITSKNLKEDGTIDFSNVSLISEKDYLEINKRSKVDVGDILFGMIGTIGRPVLTKSCNYAIKNVALIKNGKSIYNNYLIHYLHNKHIERQFLLEQAGGTQKFIALGVIRNLIINTPCFEEQKKIADFLSKVDERISVQQSIVSALEDQKKGLTQKLFSQEVRFKADDGSDYPDWDVHEFNEVFSMLQNNTFSRVCLNQDEGEALNIHYGDVLIKYDSFVDIDVERVPFINSDILLDKFNEESYLLDGDVIIADTAEDNTVGKVVEIFNARERKILSGLHTIPCRPKKRFASKYLGYYLNSFHYHNQIIHLIQGIKVSSISKTNCYGQAFL